MLELWLKQRLAGTDVGHDYWHAVRVRYNAVKIADSEGGNIKVIKTAALVHDLVDDKFFDPYEAEREIRTKLAKLGYSDGDVDHVIRIITSMSFSKELDGAGFDSLEFRVVQDADRLDAIGAIGIARTFSYGGFKGRELYNPAVPFEDISTKQQYRSGEGMPTVSHFYEKLLRLKDMMKTETGRRMTEERHLFMERYLEQFFKEWGDAQ